MKLKVVIIFLTLAMLAISCSSEESLEDQETICELTEEESRLVNEISDQYATAFSGPDPSIDDAQLSPLIDYLAEAHIVGLGEATHGTSEFYKMKDKIFRQLVQKKNFKAIVFEIPWGNALVVNDYVIHGIGSAESAVNQTYYWTYDTQEVRDMVEWIHDYNMVLPEEDRIWFVGCDPQGGDFSVERSHVAGYLHDIDPDTAVDVLTNYSFIPGDLADYSNMLPSIQEANRQGIEKVLNHLILSREEYTQRSSELEYQVTLMAAHVIQQRERLYRIGNFGVPRDSLMAVYSEWWQEILEEDAHVAIWAHNAHVMDAADFNADWMGTFLKQRHRQDYRNVAFSFGSGSFNAFLSGSNGDFQSGVREQFIPEWECHSVNHILSSVDGDQHYLFFEELGGATKDYFHTQQPFVQLGAGFNYNFIHNYTRQWRLANMFDVIIHFDETTSSDLR